MASAAGLAAATSTIAFADEAPAPAQPVKWQPFFELNAGGDNQSGIGGVMFFAPLSQTNDQLLFARVGVQTRFKSDNIENLGLGYRQKINGDWILGGFLGIDHSETGNSNVFNQYSLGLEAISTEWDAHLNGYLAKRHPTPVIGSFQLDIHGTFIGIKQEQEAAFSGFDGEVGYRLVHDGSTDIRFYAGGYDFQVGDSKNFATKQITGPKGGVELDIYDLDFIGPQSRFSVRGELRDDDLRGTSGFVGASLRIPLGDRSGAGAQALDELDRRMVDSPRRNDSATVSAQYNKNEPVIIYGHGIASQPTNTLLYVDNTAGAGTLDNPTTLKDATTRKGPNQFIVLTDNDGKTVHTGGATIRAGETVAAGGNTFTVKGADSGVTFSHLFGPGTKGPITLDNPGGTGLVLQANTALYGFTLSGDFTTAIYGHNVHDVSISHVTIDGLGTSTDAIVIKQDKAGTANINISNTTITGFTGNGIELDVTNVHGGTLGVDLNVSHSNIDVGGTGIYLPSNTKNGSTSTVNLGVHDSVINAGGTPIDVPSSVSSGGTLNQSIVIDPTVLTGGDYGIHIGGYADAGSLNQNIVIDDVTISGTAISGIDIDNYAGHGGTVTVNAKLNTVSVTGGYEGIHIYGGAYDTGSTVSQTVAMTHIDANHASKYAGITLLAFAGDSGAVTQTLGLNDVSVSDSAAEGIQISAADTDAGHIIQTVNVAHLTSIDNAYEGVAIRASADGSGSILAQYVSINDATLTGNGFGYYGGTGYGFGARVFAGNHGVARQDVSLTHATVSDGGQGIQFSSGADTLGSAEQNIFMNRDVVQNNADGVALRMDSSAATGGFAAQTAYVYHSDMSHAATSGLVVSGYAVYGGNVEQSVFAYYDDFSHSVSGPNVQITAVAAGYLYPTNAPGYAYYSHVKQIAVVYNSDLSHGGDNGLDLRASGLEFGEVNQYAYFNGDDISHNVNNGVSIDVEQATGASVYSNAGIYNSRITHNGSSGVSAYSVSTGGANYYGDYLIGTLNLIGDDLSHNAFAGLYDITLAGGKYSFNSQTITIADSHLDHEGYLGAAFATFQNYGYGGFGAAVQNITIQGSTFNHNLVGLGANASATGVQGRAEQHFTVSNSQFDNNALDGIRLTHLANGGDYRNGLSCDEVQGVTGGCAFVRQTFIGYGIDASYNGRTGIYVGNSASNYGAIYNQGGRPAYPTIYLGYSNVSNNGVNGLEVRNIVSGHSFQYDSIIAIGTHFDHNGNDGIHLSNNVSGDSTLAQNIYVADSSMDHNVRDGLYSSSYVGAGGLMVQIAALYSYAGPMTANANGGDGIVMATRVAGTGKALSGLLAVGVEASGNTGNGIAVQNTSVGGGQSIGQVGVYLGTFADNGGSGIRLDGDGTGAAQYVGIGYNTITGNGTGIRGRATNGAYQYIDLSYGNTVSGNSVNYLFTYDGLSLQIVNY